MRMILRSISEEVRLHDLVVPVLSIREQGDDEHEQKPPLPPKASTLALHVLAELLGHLANALVHVVPNVVVHALRHLVFEVVDVEFLVLDQLLGVADAAVYGGELILEAVLQKSQVRAQALDLLRLLLHERVHVCGGAHWPRWHEVQHGRVHLFHRLDPRPLQGQVRDTRPVVHFEGEHVVVVHEVPRGRGEAKVVVPRQLTHLSVDAVHPVSLVRRSLAHLDLDAAFVVLDMRKRGVLDREVIAHLRVAEVEGAARALVLARHRVPRAGLSAHLLVVPGLVVVCAVIGDDGDIGVLVVVGLVDVLEGVEEDTQPLPHVLPAKDLAGHVLCPLAKPQRETVAKELGAAPAHAELEHRGPRLKVDGHAIEYPTTVALGVAR
mmetsp:Transcript_15949/g.42976  ORF Transcript_15949/g.42976 Transcript_15949/m.42976 type:complete len:380 (-) Transcript_15949:205-1344(-)